MKQLIALILSTASLLAVDYTLPANRLADWTPGVQVGVPGGINQYRPGGASQRTVLRNVVTEFGADNTGATNAAPAVQAAVDAATAGQVVYLPAGTYRFNSGVGLGFKNDITVRGAGPNLTQINYFGVTDGAFNMGTDAYDYTWSYPDAPISGSPVKGATVLPMPDTSNIVVGALTEISLTNNTTADVPVVSVGGFQNMRRQKTMCVAKTASTMTIFPGLYFNLPASLSPIVAQASRWISRSGFEDFSVDASSASTPHPIVRITQGYACWIYNVKSTNTPNYNFAIADSVQCEIRHSDGHGRQIEGTNGASLLAGTIASCLFEDNIFGENFPILEINGGSTGNVFAYNYMYKSSVFGGAAAAIDTNHGPHNSYNLYEGNIAPNVQCDGYFGGASEDTMYRNWLSGVNSNTADIRGICVNFNRFTRNYSVVGNILGATGGTSFIYPEGAAQWGMPNMGNFSWEGTASPLSGDFWADFGTAPGAGGFQELDLDVAATNILKGNYQTEGSAIPPAESLTGMTLANSLFRTSKPSYFGNLTWPPMNPTAPFTPAWNSTNWARIPAGYRFVNGVDPPSGTPDTTIPTPSPMTFASAPTAVDSTSVTMTATTATDTESPTITYLFDETSGNPGGTDSAWQTSPTYVDLGLSPSTTYTYRVKARDGALNETAFSTAANVTTTAAAGPGIGTLNVTNLRVGQ
jgi:hypothetical protein